MLLLFWARRSWPSGRLGARFLAVLISEALCARSAPADTKQAQQARDTEQVCTGLWSDANTDGEALEVRGVGEPRGRREEGRVAGKAPAPDHAIRAADRLGPLVEVPALVERAVRTRRADVTPHICQLAARAAHRLAAVGLIRRRRRCGARRLRVRAGRIIEVDAAGTVVRRLVPLVLARQENRHARVARHRGGVARRRHPAEQRVCPRLGVAAALAVA